jgi:hypothetical protein
MFFCLNLPSSKTLHTGAYKSKVYIGCTTTVGRSLLVDPTWADLQRQLPKMTMVIDLTVNGWVAKSGKIEMLCDTLKS